MEAVSRGASAATLLERDVKLAGAIEDYLKKFGIDRKASVVKTDVYRWAERWLPPAGPVNVFFSPPFADLTERVDDFMGLVRLVMDKVADDSVVVLQAEDGFKLDRLPEPDAWDQRNYGRNILLFWVKGESREEARDAGDAAGNP